MARYNWDLYELRNNINLLQQVYKTESNDENKQLIMESISMYKNMIDLVVKREKNRNEILNDSLEYDDFDSLVDEQIISYQNNDYNVLNAIIQSYLPFRDTYSSDFILRNVPIIATNDELVDIANDFGNKMLPYNVRKDFSTAINDIGNINFSYSKLNECYAGITLFEPILKQKYIFISRTNKLIDLVTLPHELFHYIFNDHDVGIVCDYNMNYTTEIEGSFANILFGDYFYKNSSENRNYFNEFFLEIYHSGISEIVVRNSFLDAIKDNRRIRMHKFNKSLEYWGLVPFVDKEEILDYLVDPLDINIKYILGYLIGIDLYYIYEKDPEFAFYLLKNMRYMKCEDDVIGLLRRNHITFMDDEFENLKKYIKKIERQS